MAVCLAACTAELPSVGTGTGMAVDTPIDEPVAFPNSRSDDGRHVTAYVTYYGTLTPDKARKILRDIRKEETA